jgi:hypothetical protein
VRLVRDLGFDVPARTVCVDCGATRCTEHGWED